MVTRTLVTLSICLMLGMVNAGAEVYRWVDDKGKVHYGDRPKDSQSETVNVKPAPKIGTLEKPSGNTDWRKIQEDMVRSYDEQQTEKQKQQEQKAEQQKKLAKLKKECEKNQATYETFDRRRHYTESPTGEKMYLSEEETRKYKSDLESWLNEYCN